MIQPRTARLLSRVALVAATTALVVLTTASPTPATITGVSPGSRTVEAGTSQVVTTTVTSDVGGISATAGAPLQVVPAGGGCGGQTTCTISVQVFSSAAPGSYTVSIIDAGGGGASFTVNVVAPATTTTTAPPATTTTTTRPPTTTTTTSTTTSTTTTTEPPTTTTSTTTSTTTTSTTTSTTTTTLPPTTTTVTLVPTTTLSADGGSQGGGGGLDFPVLPVAVVGLALLVLIAVAIAAARGGAFNTVGVRRRMAERKLRRRARRGSHSSVSAWWRMSGPVVAFREWRSSRRADKDIRRRIAERRDRGRR